MSDSLVAGAEKLDVCVVGAGYAGLNALFVAGRCLPASARVVVLDRHQGPGGMWNDAYSYVRLHQPYRFFTAGNIPWSLRRERSYLASRDEVAAHLRHCFDVISTRLNIDARWGWEYVDHVEDAASVLVTARDPDGQTHTFMADRFIDATGFDVESLQPLPLSSQQVSSIAPNELAESGLLDRRDDAPVWIVGSGKTAMDTVIALARANPARPIGMVTGAGTYFYSRDVVNPTGLKRWTGGVRYNAIFAGAAERFDGTNAEEVAAWCRRSVGTSPLRDPAPPHLLFALLSEAEATTVTDGVRDVIRDHLTDVVDDASGPALLLRSGARQSIPAGSCIVNCTSHLAPRDAEHVPYVSPSGRSMSINSTSVTLPNSAVSAYFMSHLFFRNKLADAALYELDFHGLRRDAPAATLAVVSALTLYNLSLVFERVPTKAFQESHLDIDRWYPRARQLAGQIQFMRTHKRNRPRHRHALDTFSRNTGVRCGPLDVTVPAPRAATEVREREPTDQ
jgi:hypothetical protein